MPTTGFFTINAAVQETLTTPENHSGAMFDIIRQSYQFSNGNAAGQNNLVWSDRGSVAVGVPVTIDLNGGGLLDVFGAAVNFASVTGIMIYNRNTVAGDVLRFGPAAANPFQWTFSPGGGLYVEVGVTGGYCQWVDAAKVVVAGASDQITLTATGVGPITYDILIIGRA
jgi:hypothetical protein